MCCEFLDHSVTFFGLVSPSLSHSHCEIEVCLVKMTDNLPSSTALILAAVSVKLPASEVHFTNRGMNAHKTRFDYRTNF